MARTEKGEEFYLVSIYDPGNHPISELRALMSRYARRGDGIFEFDTQLFAAIVGPMIGAGKAARRIQRGAQHRGFEVSVKLVYEPLPDELQGAAQQVMSGQIAVRERGMDELATDRQGDLPPPRDFDEPSSAQPSISESVEPARQRVMARVDIEKQKSINREDEEKSAFDWEP